MVENLITDLVDLSFSIEKCDDEIVFGTKDITDNVRNFKVISDKPIQVVSIKLNTSVRY